MDDLISRQAAIDKINERKRKLIYCFGFENDAVKIMDIAKSIVIAIPSAQQEGKWKKEHEEWFTDYPYKCTNCGKYSRARYHFCPNCGADMRGKIKEGN